MNKNYRKISLLLSTLLTCSISYSQYTTISDQNFEQALINDGLDDIIDNQVLTSNISGITILNINSENINNLNGIEDFISLERLYVVNNNLNSINLSNNIALTHLGVGGNNFTTLAFPNNTSLQELSVSNNSLSSINLSSNSNLRKIWFENTNFQEIDLSNNPEVDWIKGGNNSNLQRMSMENLYKTGIGVDLQNSYNITCIIINSINQPSTYWTNNSPWYNFNTNCGYTLSTNSIQNEIEFIIYPNPVSDKLFIKSKKPIDKLEIFNMQGSLIAHKFENSINVSHLSNGLYIVKVFSINSIQTKKIIIKNGI